MICAAFLLVASGFHSAEAAPPADTLAFALFTDPSLTERGLRGYYVDQCLQLYSQQDDWVATQDTSGSRVDTTIAFTDNSDWGTRADVRLTHGSDSNWDLFSVQWDGYLQILDDARFATKSDDASRMWIDIDHDGAFASSGDEFIDNHWGMLQTITLGPESRLLPRGVYKIRIQYYELGGGNYMEFVARRRLIPLGAFSGREFFVTSAAVTIDSARILAAEIAQSRTARCFVATDGSHDLHEWLRARVSTAGPAWIGLTDERDERVWRWDSGEDYSHAFWQVGEPSSGLAENHVATNGALGGGWVDYFAGGILPAILEVYARCPVPDSLLKADDNPDDEGHRIELDWSAYSGATGSVFQIYRSGELCHLAGPAFGPVGTTTAQRFVDETVPDYETQYYRVDVELGGLVVDTLISGPAVAHPNLVFTHEDIAAGTVEIRNRSSVPVNVDGFRVAVLSRNLEFFDEQVLSGTIPARGGIIFEPGLVEAKARIFLLPPSTEYRIDSKLLGRVSATALPNAFEGYQAGRPIRVNVALPSFLDFQAGRLFVRLGGSRTEWADSLRLPPSGLVPTAVIPDSLVGPRGLEYWVEVQTAQGPYSDPPDLLADGPLRLRVTSAIAERTASPGLRYRMASIPLEFQNAELQSGDILALHLGANDPRYWRLFAYSPFDSANVEWQAEAVDSIFRASPGRSFWLITREPYRIDTGQTLFGRSVSTEAPFRIFLQPGWNQVGNPFAFPIAWDPVQRDTSAVGPPMSWDPTQNRYVDLTDGILAPFSGVFVENLSDHAIGIAIPPREAESPTAPAAPRVAPDQGGWSVHVRIRGDGETSDVVELGTSPGASADYDGRDLRKAPVPPGSRVSLSIDDSGFHNRPGNYQRDVRPIETPGHQWTLRAHGTRPDESLTLEMHLMGPRPADLRMGMFVNSNEFIELMPPGFEDPEALVSLPTGNSTQSIRVIAGTAAYVEQSIQMLPIPERLNLEACHPNPSRRSATIRFGLPRAERVFLVVYDAQGRLVRKIIDAETLTSGFHSRTWSGINDRGETVRSGLYFVRLQSPSGIQTRKLILTR